RTQGRLAKQITALLFRGTLKHVDPSQLNGVAWRIQAGVRFQQWSPQEQQMAHDLIPEYENDLKGDFVEKIEDDYAKLLQPLTKKSFEEQLASMGDIGKEVLKLKKSREVLANKVIAGERLPDMLYQQTGDRTPMKLSDQKGSPSPWIILQQNVIARFTVQQGYLGHNLLELRVFNNVGSNFRKLNSGLQAVRPEISFYQQPTTLRNIMNGSGAIDGMGLMAFSIGRAAQAPILAPSLKDDPSYFLLKIAQGVNPNPSVFDKNCGYIVVAVIDRLKNENSKAIASKDQYPEGFDGLEKMFNTKINWDQGFQEAFDAVKKGGNGTIGIIGLLNIYKNVSHVIVITNKNGTVAIIEGQNGGSLYTSADLADIHYNKYRNQRIGFGIIKN
ncbi:MAG: toxin glutamine deamidase domain-containing protein, partial [Bacteroidota bacterium]